MTRLILAGAAQESGQKVHNLRVATESLPPEITYLAFFDADARPTACWLRVLLARLDRGEVGATTGYRWFVPLRPSLANHSAVCDERRDRDVLQPQRAERGLGRFLGNPP